MLVRTCHSPLRSLEQGKRGKRWGCWWFILLPRTTLSSLDSVIIGAAVAVVMKERAKQLYITCGVLFSAGVLLAGGFVHLVSDSHDDFQELNITDFQWAFAIAGGTVAVLASLELALD